MAKERRQPPLSLIGNFSYIAAALFLLLPQQQLQAAADSNTSRRGLSLGLVHRDSIRSPSYPGPLTDLQRLERTIRLSRFPRARDEVGPLATATSSAVPLDDTDDICGIAPPITYGGFYVVTLGLGTPLKVVTLVLDTGSDVAWTQCVPSNPQFRQLHPLFDPAGSSSFRYVDPKNDGCKLPSRLSGQYCSYEINYGSGERTSGLLGQETFHFHAPREDGGIMNLPDLTFGCSHSSEGGFFDDTEDGILGLGGGPLSFATQVGSYYGGRFSYCLFDYRDSGGQSFLLFGDDIRMIGDVQTTPFLETNQPTHYHLNLAEIVLSGLKLGLYPEVYFPNGQQGRGGTIIDSGAVGFLYDPAFDALKEIVTAFFGLYDYTPFDLSTTSAKPLEICYNYDNNPAALEEDLFLTYVFIGPAFLEVPSKYLFTHMRDNDPPFFCLAMFRNSERTLIGFWQQRDVRFTYDLVRGVLHFVPEDCTPSGGD